MKKIRLRNIAVFGLAALSGALLLHTSQSVQVAEEKLHDLQADAQREQDAIRMLKAEWAYLNSPERLEVLAKKYTNLVPPDPQQITDSLPAAAQDQTMPGSYIEINAASSAMPDPVPEKTAPEKITPPKKPDKKEAP